MDDTIRKLIRKHKTNDPFIIANQLNINIWFQDLGESTRGIYIRKLKRRYIIIHNSLDEHWQRFICAHELGHDRLHPGLNRFWLDEHSFYNAGKYERQANKFAIRLLTANDYLLSGDSLTEFLSRNNIPPELSKFYL